MHVGFDSLYVGFDSLYCTCKQKCKCFYCWDYMYSIAVNWMTFYQRHILICMQKPSLNIRSILVYLIPVFVNVIDCWRFSTLIADSCGHSLGFVLSNRRRKWTDPDGDRLWSGSVSCSSSESPRCQSPGELFTIDKFLNSDVWNVFFFFSGTRVV